MTTPSTFDEYRKAYAEAIKDAERYRWLRDKSDSAYGIAPIAIMVDDCCQPAFDKPGYAHNSARIGDNLDAAIDAAMEQSK